MNEKYLLYYLNHKFLLQFIFLLLLHNFPFIPSTIKITKTVTTTILQLIIAIIIPFDLEEAMGFIFVLLFPIVEEGTAIFNEVWEEVSEELYSGIDL